MIYCTKCYDVVGPFNATKEGMICDYCLGIKIKPKTENPNQPIKDTSKQIFNWTR